jgi:hypothetical protein
LETLTLTILTNQALRVQLTEGSSQHHYPRAIVSHHRWS